MVNKVEICGVNTAKLPLYKEAEMMQMIEKIQAGDQAVRDEFIKGNLQAGAQRDPAIFQPAAKIADDLFQVGCIGLIKAHRQFRSEPWREVFHLCGAHDHRGDPALSQRQQRDPRFALACGIWPTRRCRPRSCSCAISCSGSRRVEEIADGYGARPARTWCFALESIQEPISLFEPVFHDDGDALYVMDQVQDTKNTDLHWIENLSLSEAMKKLTPRERHILNMRFFEGKTQMEVAKEIAISQAQVSRLEKNALKYMRKYV